jgi:hypothetical protein
MKTTPDISSNSVEFALRMYERAAVDAEFSKYYQRQLDERAAREAFVTRIIEGLAPHRFTTLELCCFLAVALTAVAVIAFAACEIVRLIKTYGI